MARKSLMATAIMAGLAFAGRFVEADGDTEGHLVEGSLSFDQTSNLLQAALRRHYGLGQAEWIYPDSIYADRVIVRRDGKLIEFPYSIAANNEITLGAAREVVMEPVPISGQLVEAVRSADDQAPTNRFVIRVIRSGLSRNGVDYPAAVLRESAPLFDRARVCAVSDEEHIRDLPAKRDAGKIIGRLSKPRFVESGTGGELLADLVVIDSGWADRFREAISAGAADLFGFSIDASGTWKKAGRFREATAINKVASVDVVSEPGAGGQLIRLVEAVNPASRHQESIMNRAQMLALLQKMNPNRAAALADASDAEVAGAFREACEHAAQTNGNGVTADAVAEQIRMVEARVTARTTIAGSGLPAPAVERLQADFNGRASFVEADVTAAITAERAYLGRFVETPITGLGGGSVVAGQDRSEKVREQLDHLFDPARRAGSFREAYADITGDRAVTGLLANCNRTRLAEALGGGRFVEAVSAATFAEILGDSITRAMVRDYNLSNMWDDWRVLCDVVPVNDFRTQRRTRMGGYGNLPAVAENGAYAALTTPGDEEATYAATKRGGTETISIEAIANDDVGAIRRIPSKLAQAAKQTLYRFVLDFLATNAAIYDTVALAHATHNNLGATALSAATFAAARLAMLQQVEAGSTERIGLVARHLFIPTNLEETAFDLFVRNTNNDETFVQSRKPTAHVVPYWTDANNWWVTADKADVPLIELGFYGGREEPELFVQDNPTQGSLFSNDQLKYKMRHIYGGAVKDYRGFYGAVVA